MKPHLKTAFPILLLHCVLVQAAADPETNIALGADPIMGHAALDNGTFGVYHINAQTYLTPHNSSTPGELNDGDRTSASVVNTYSGDGYVDDPNLESPDQGRDPYDFLGVQWAAPVDGVTTVVLYQQIYGDGGWFGTTSGAVTPKVQVTRNGGTTWTDIPDVLSDYADLVIPSAQSGRIVGPITFTFAGQDAIDGIRLFGEGGGLAGFDTSGFVSAAELEAYSDARPPAPVDYETNVALGADPLMGLAPIDNGAFGIYHINAQGYLTPHNSEVPADLNDGDRTAASVVDTYSGDGFVDDPTLENPDGGLNPFDFLGVAWEKPRSGVAAIRLYQRIFGDGGWFGGLSSALAPKVQVTRDGGSTWTDVASVQSDYESIVSPSTQSGQIVGPITFTFPAQHAIDGIRIFGESGGKAGLDTSGFVSAAEFEVYEALRPQLSLSRDGGAFVLTWTDNAALESNPGLGGDWTEIDEATSPYTIPQGSDPAFFRLTW